MCDKNVLGYWLHKTEEAREAYHETTG